MRTRRFSQAQIIAMIKAREARMPTVEMCRKHGPRHATFYKCKPRCGGTKVLDAAKLKALADENAKLNRLVATWGQGG